jgi:hypothetical protein
MKITSKDILEALISKTISIQEARLIINEAYGEESYGHGEGYRYDDDPESDMIISFIPAKTKNNGEQTPDLVKVYTGIDTDTSLSPHGSVYATIFGLNRDQFNGYKRMFNGIDVDGDSFSCSEEDVSKLIHILDDDNNVAVKLSKSKITMNDINHAYESKIITSKEARLLVEEYGQKDGMCPDCGCKLETDGHCAMCDKQY